MDPPEIFFFLFLGCLCMWGLIPYSGLNSRGSPEPPWVDYANQRAAKSCSTGGNPLSLAPPGGRCPKRAESLLYLSFPRGAPKPWQG